MKNSRQQIKVIYEDNHVLGIVKPSGWLSQRDRTGDDSVIDWTKAYIKEKYNKPGKVFMGCVHRLDRPTSGVMVYARTSKALKRLNREFAERRTEKKYIALVQGAVPRFNDKLVHYLKKNRKKNIVKASTQQYSGSKKAVLDYTMIGQLGDMFLLDITLETGRPHQIRAQLAKAGFPIVGDRKYKSKENLPNASIALHCYSLVVKHPTTDEPLRLHSEPYNVSPWDRFKDLINQQL